MLQLAAQHRSLIDGYVASGALAPRWTTMAELERCTDRWVHRLRRDRERLAEGHGLRLWSRAALDRLLRTERVEYLDRDDVEPAAKVQLVRQLHLLNRILRSYRRFLVELRPHIERVHRRARRPARLLELASGSGEFTLGLAARAAEEGLPLEVTGSDIVPRYVGEGARLARSRGLDVRFRVVNAFDMSDVQAGDYDLVFIAQSMHHFSPGQLAMMIAQSRRVAAAGFVGIDGYRSPAVLVALSLVGALNGYKGLGIAYRMWHDATVSGRKFLPQGELELIARIAAPGDGVVVRRSGLSHSVLEVTPPGCAARRVIAR